MGEIIKTIEAVINNETVNAVNARELWTFLEVKTQFKDWIVRRINEYGFAEGEDFCCSNLSRKNRQGGHNRKEYIITLDMAKELAMVENNDKGRQARQYFIEVEKNARKIAGAINQQIAAVIPIIRENERLKMQYDFAKNFLPHGNPGDLNENGEPKTRFRRGYYTAGKGRSITALIERAETPNLFDAVELKKLDGVFGK